MLLGPRLVRVWSAPLCSRTISLGIRPISVIERPDLGKRYTASDRHRPSETGVNGPVMARHEWVLSSLAVTRGCDLSVLVVSGGSSSGLTWIRRKPDQDRRSYRRMLTMCNVTLLRVVASSCGVSGAAMRGR